MTADGATLFLGAAPDEVALLVSALDLDVAEIGPDGLGRILEHAIGARSTAAVGAALRAAGVGVHPVASVRELMAPGGVADRRGLRLEDQTDGFGAVVMPGPVVRFGRTPMRPGAVPGPFGSDRSAVLERLAATAPLDHGADA